MVTAGGLALASESPLILDLLGFRLSTLASMAVDKWDQEDQPSCPVSQSWDQNWCSHLLDTPA